ncbi:MULTISPECIES: hypothetical protein [Brevibacillus]|jgi:hypothetical protein|uniref:Uncharacterized protein n=1 Tax=Brevibacillus borstelensis AK1 TaxID=1300222 RepID=M8EHA0_9BACL|nr:hypothetical protein [Brevibacillus borstelensis]EMT54845.1 hypothetical protein I532_04535 [Brevibacillus borstelensis AK1]KKX52688.1 hypothetical protein X546_23775 [Brevibacillus borstelensis cifa_chp40]MBE5394281.1 hypothetical protein [Brevibacillus borstelensis]MCC0565223.1 hypothetical protein [Brevibacillus borstelensis]MCM3471975.1 hypothetical protein [Brevibacillus borstelensis]
MKRPTYTLSSIVKKVFRSGERSLPREEICARLNETGLISLLDMDAEALLAKVLQMEQSPVRIGRTEAIVEVTYQPHQLFDLAYRFLRDTQSPKTLEQIVAELRRQTQFGWNQIMRMLQLERDLRFVQYQGDVRWFLADWTLANDQVYQFCRKNGIAQISVRSLTHFLELEAEVPQGSVFLSALDDRFRTDEETLHIIVREDITDSEEDDADAEPDGEQVEWELEKASAEAAPTTAQIEQQSVNQAPSEQSEVREEIAASPAKAPDEQQEAPPTRQHEQHEQLQFEEELPMNAVQTQSAYQEAKEMLRLALDRLQVRNQEMAQEVVAHFQKSNMQAIEVLMKEKHKNEQLALGIEQVLKANDQQ